MKLRFLSTICFIFHFFRFKQNITNSKSAHHQPFNASSEFRNNYFNLPLLQGLTSHYFSNITSIESNNHSIREHNLNSDADTDTEIQKKCAMKRTFLNNFSINSSVSMTSNHFVINSIIGVMFYLSCYFCYYVYLIK